MKKFLLAGLVAVSGSVAAESEPRLDNELALIEAWMSVQHQYDRVPGVSWAVVRGPAVVGSGASGLADVESGEPARPDTIYGICSISKLFTGVAAMQLRDAGKYRLDDPVADLLPWFNIRQVHEDSPEITLEGMLTHSAGLPRESDTPYWSYPQFEFPDSDTIQELLGGQQTLYPASQTFQYSNLGLSLVGEVVAEQSGQSFDAYVREHILKPLDLEDTDTGFPSDEREPRVATGYAAPRRDGSLEALPRYDAAGIAPAAGFSSTALDLAKFAVWQLMTREGKGNSVLSSNTLMEMQRVHWMEWDWSTSWGLAFGIYRIGDRTLTGHAGSCPGFNTRMYIDPNAGTGVAVMANRNNVNVDGYAQTLLKILSAGGTPEDHDRRFAEYAGFYDFHPWGGESLLYEWNGQLMATWVPSGDPLDADVLEHIEGDRFRVMTSDGQPRHEVVFQRNAQGQVVSYLSHSNRSFKVN